MTFVGIFIADSIPVSSLKVWDKSFDNSRSFWLKESNVNSNSSKEPIVFSTIALYNSIKRWLKHTSSLIAGIYFNLKRFKYKDKLVCACFSVILEWLFNHVPISFCTFIILPDLSHIFFTLKVFGKFLYVSLLNHNFILIICFSRCFFISAFLAILNSLEKSTSLSLKNKSKALNTLDLPTSFPPENIFKSLIFSIVWVLIER